MSREKQIAKLRGPPCHTPYDPRVRAIKQMRAQQRALAVSAPRAANSAWTEIGPKPLPIPNGNPATVPGRVSAIAVDPTNSNIVYLGAAQGRARPSSDGGDPWNPAPDSATAAAVGGLPARPYNHHT